MFTVGAHVSISGSLDQAIDRAVDIGADCIQIHGQSPQVWAKKRFSTDEIVEFKKKKTEHNVNPVFLHGIYLINLATENQDLLDKSKDSLVHYLQLARDFDAQGVIFHLGSGKESMFHHPLEQIVKAVNEILEKTSDCPQLIFEQTVSNGNKIGSFSDLGWLVKKINNSRVKVCLDTCHLFADGYALGGEGLKTTVSEATKHGIFDKIVAIHVNDAKFDFNSKKDRHENIGEGKVGLPVLKEFLSLPEINNLPLILEVPGFDNLGPDKQNIGTLKQLLNS